MGSLAPSTMLNFLQQGIGLAQTFGGQELAYRRDVKDESRALAELQERQALSQQQAAEQTALEKQQLAASAQAYEDQRRAALKRAVARQRAAFGGSGIAQGSGSSQAVLLGLYNETEEELAQRERMDNLRSSALDQNLSQQKSLNVLQYEQLKQRQKLDNAVSTYNRVNNFVDFGVGSAVLGLNIHNANQAAKWMKGI